MRTYRDKVKHSVNGRYSILKYSAKSRGKEVLISLEEYAAIVAEAVCHFCKGGLPRAGGGLDRLDHTKPYQIGNVVPCCKACNHRKGKLESAGFSYPRTVELMRELIDIQLSNIGEPQRVIISEPLSDPVPHEIPTEQPVSTPEPVEPEKVPA